MVKKSRGSISANRKVVRIKFLDGEESLIDIEADSKVQELFNKACYERGIEETEHFGLTEVSADFNSRFLDLETKISKYAPKSWRTSNQGLDAMGEPLMTLSLEVSFYVKKLSSIRDSAARNYYFLQLRKNFITYPILYPDDRCFLQATYSMIASNYTDQHDLFDPRIFFPAWVIEKHGTQYIKTHMPQLIRDFSDISNEEASNLFSTALSQETPIPFNIHLVEVYKDLRTKPVETVKKPAAANHTKQFSHQDNHTSFLGLGPNGIGVFEVGVSGFIDKSKVMKWSEIEDLKYTRRKFEVRGYERSLTLYTKSEETSDYLLNLCLLTHKMQDVKRPSNQSVVRSSIRGKQSKYRESYIFFDDTDLESISEVTASPTGAQAAKPSVYTKRDVCNRYSIVSNASSTTSGIVSDRTCFSYYDSQEEALDEGKGMASSQDSLLQPPESESKSRPVQRAISEPSKKFQQLRELKVLQSKQPIMSRAVSDDTVRGPPNEDHIYENINAVRNRLLAAAMAKPSKLSPRVSLSTSLSIAQLSASRPLEAPNKHRFLVQSQGSLHHSTSQLNQLIQMQKQPGFRSQQNMMKPSPSMEQLLRDYQPPPSYNEKHKKIREQMIADMKIGNLAVTQSSGIHKSYKTTLSKAEPIQQRCTCNNASQTEIDNLKDITGLPLISALCNDKNLQPINSLCPKCEFENKLASRPISWHSESFMLPTSTPLPQESY